jgi:hypothetical protein
MKSDATDVKTHGNILRAFSLPKKTTSLLDLLRSRLLAFVQLDSPTLSVNTGTVHGHRPGSFSSECAVDIMARCEWKSSWRVLPTKLSHYQIQQMEIELGRLEVKGRDLATVAWRDVSGRVTGGITTRLFRYQIQQM